MNIYVETLYDKDMIIRFNRIYLADFFRKNFSILAIAALAAAGFSLAVGQWEAALLIVGLIVVYAGLTLAIQHFARMQALKKSPIVKHPIIRSYRFEDEHVTIDARYVEPDVEASAEIRFKPRRVEYVHIAQVRVRGEFMTIYAYDPANDDRRTYVVSKTNFASPEELAELQEFLRNKLGNRYR